MRQRKRAAIIAAFSLTIATIAGTATLAATTDTDAPPVEPQAAGPSMDPSG